VQTPLDCNAELVLDLVCHIKPVQVAMQNVRQPTAELVHSVDEACCSYPSQTSSQAMTKGEQVSSQTNCLVTITLVELPKSEKNMLAKM